MKHISQTLPFTLNRTLRVPLSTQLAESLRKTILTGYYKPGDILPSYKQIAKELGVSLRIPREAMADLVARNLVAPRPRIGCEVLPRHARYWNGRIHVVSPSDTFISYFAAAFFENFRRLMTERGWLVELLTFSRNEKGKSSFILLDEALNRTSDFTLLIYPTAASLRHIESAKTRYMCLCNNVDLRKNYISISFDPAMNTVVDQIRKSGLRRLTLVEYKSYPVIHCCLRKAGLAFKSLKVPEMTGIGYLERISRKGFELTRQLLQSRKKELPELIFFTDDFVARGGLCAILEAGLKVPEDISILTFSNRGFAPVFPVKLARIEADPFDLAAKASDEVLRRIAGQYPQQVSGPVQFHPGPSLRSSGSSRTQREKGEVCQLAVPYGMVHTTACHNRHNRLPRNI